MTKKYRPYFTLPELEAILESLKMNPRVVIQGKSLVTYTERFIRDIKDGLRDSSLTLAPKLTLTQKLGLDDRTLGESKEPTDSVLTLVTLYQRYLSDGYVNMSPAEISSLNQYMFENDLMDPEMESAYVAELMKKG